MFTFYDAWCFVLFAVVIMIVYCFAGVEAASYRDDDDEDGDEDNDVDEEDDGGNYDEDVDNYDDDDNDDVDNDDIDDDDDDDGGGFDRCLGEGGCWRGDCVSMSHWLCLACPLSMIA